MNLKGHSGDSLVLVEIRGRTCIRKTPSHPSRWARMRGAAYKQKFAPLFPGLRAPAVHQVCDDEQFFTQEFSYGRNLTDHLVASEQNALAVGHILGDVVLDCLRNSEMLPFRATRFTDKLQAVIDVIAARHEIPVELRNRIIRCGTKMIGKIIVSEATCCPVGWSHGDLTLTNVLAEPDGSLVWFDFLTGWDWSPLCDIAKLHQEARYGWSLRFSPDNYGMHAKRFRDRVQMILKIVQMKTAQFYEPEVLEFFVMLNDYRLLQYETDLNWIDVILAEIEEML